MTKDEIAEALRQMTCDMENARLSHQRSLLRLQHQTDPLAWEALKKTLGYQEPES